MHISSSHPVISKHLRTRVFFGLFFLSVFTSGAASDGVKPEHLDFIIHVPDHVAQIEVQVRSFRNQPVVRNADRSPLAPDDWADKPGRLPDRALWFPVLDVVPDGGMEAVVEFSGVNSRDVYVLNGMFDPVSKPLQSRIVFPAANLLYWENLLWVNAGDVVLDAFYLREVLEVENGRVHFQIKSLSPEWRGTISWRDSAHPENELGRIAIDTPTVIEPVKPLLLIEAAPTQAPTQGQLSQALIAWITFLLNARDTTPWSPTRDGFNLFYDLDASTYRTTHWMWAWGVDIRLLLEAAQVPGVAGAFKEDLEAVAIKAGRRSLEFQWDKAGHPADGLVTVRWNPGHQWNHGAKEFVATADALFLAGWAWVPLYERTHDAAFLNATQRLAQAVDQLAREHPILPQDWLPGDNQWRISMLNEIAFGVEGFAELYRVRPEPQTLAAGLRFVDSLIDRFEREDGLWNRSSQFGKDTAHAAGLTHTRGQAWVMEGLLAAHRMSPQGGYLKRAERLADHLMRAQHPSGAWAFEFDDELTEGGISEKGTAVWSKLLYDLHAANGDPKVLQAARRALWFCINNTHLGPAPHAFGGIFTSSPNSGIVYRHWYRMATSYSSAWAGLAAMEEWKLGGY